MRLWPKEAPGSKHSLMTWALDPNNGLLLCANLDALFDRGLIIFEDNGHLTGRYTTANQ